MTELKCVVFWGVVTFFWTLSRGDTKVSCVFNEICVLPCSFPADHDPVIHWTHLGAEESPVHSYYNSKEQVEDQNQNFRGRTSLFVDRVFSGNASLLLTGVKILDQGRYKCSTSAAGGTQWSFVDVTVDAPVKTVHLQQADCRITCSSDGIYPEPDLTWSTIPPSRVLLRSSTTIQRTEQQLYSINSSLTVPDVTDLTYSCTVSTRWNIKMASLVNQDKTVAGQGIGIIAVVILVTVLMSLVPCFAEKCQKFWKSKQLSQEEISLTEEQPESEPVNNQGSEHEGDTSLGKSTTPPSTHKPNESNFYISTAEEESPSQCGIPAAT